MRARIKLNGKITLCKKIKCKILNYILNILKLNILVLRWYSDFVVFCNQAVKRRCKGLSIALVEAGRAADVYTVTA